MMKPVKGYELEKLMRSISRRRDAVTREFLKQADQCEPGQTMYRCFDPALPKVKELAKMLNASGKRYTVWETINGIMLRREE